MGENRHSLPVFGNDHSGTIELESPGPAFGSLLSGDRLELAFFTGDNRQEHHLVSELTFQSIDYRCLNKARPAPRSRLVCPYKLLL